MKTFAEMMPTATAEMREFVEAYAEACLLRKCIPGGLSFGSTLIDQMRATPPAKEPVSVDGVLETCKFDGKPLGLWVRIPYDRQDNGDYDHGYRVRVVKIEEEQQ